MHALALHRSSVAKLAQKNVFLQDSANCSCPTVAFRRSAIVAMETTCKSQSPTAEEECFVETPVEDYEQ